MTEKEKELWLRAQLDSVNIHPNMAKEMIQGLERSILNVAFMADLHCQCRQELSVALLTLTLGFAWHKFIQDTASIPAVRKRTDKEIQEFMQSMDAADIEFMMSNYGVQLWRSWWRPL